MHPGKTVIYLLMLAWATQQAVAAEIGPPVRDYPFEQVADNTWVIHGPLEMPNAGNQGFMNNPGIVLTTAGFVIVDPGSSLQAGEMVLRMLRKVNDSPVVAVFNTHIHGDHWLGNQAVRAAFPDAAIYGHPEMLAEVEAGAGDSWVELMANLTEGATLEGATLGTTVVGPDQAIDNGDAIRIGGKTFLIHHHGQAHTRTDLMIEVKEDGVVFLGDNVTARRIPRMSDGNFRGNIESVDMILKTGARVWVPGHGPSGDAVMVRAYRGYLEAVYRAAEQAFNDDLDSSEVKPLALEATREYSDWAGYEGEIGRQAAQAYLEVEAAEF
jgi:glyoxylase-like metal-dependent hydrolase (beta-lactamase superfamily II)